MPPYMPLIANPVTSLQLVAQALLFNWPNVETGCTGTGTDQDPYQLGRVAPQGVGNRFMLGLVTLGDAQRYGLTTAKLQAAPGHYVAADDAGMRAALALATSRDEPAARSTSTRLAAPHVREGLPGHDGRLHRGQDLRARRRHRPGRRAVHPGLHDRGPAAGPWQRTARRPATCRSRTPG